ncbi:hypothetical protein DASC09_032030 [Saccharomycopsis crataegensis]|uniref:Uncharacterized protein n=1 Tax=Saccharomycopsis crataegensis TaxID=43959 RepID=A0AAV5QNZ1_9ASCO|nr:hypothetical protein DASC09_032030 [Saccharomycopsis crataegensis]
MCGKEPHEIHGRMCLGFALVRDPAAQEPPWMRLAAKRWTEIGTTAWLWYIRPSDFQEIY